MFYQRFLKLCVSKNLKPNQVTKALGLSTATATNWKDGSIPRDITLQRIADYFGVTVGYLIGTEDTPASTVEPVASGWDLDEREQTLLTTFRSTTEEGRQLIIQSVLNIRDEMIKKSSHPAQDKAAE